MNSPRAGKKILAFLLLALALAFVPCASAKPPAADATVTFRKVFKSSSPEFVEIKVNESGSATCDIRQLDDDASPQPIVIEPQIVKSIFDLAAALHNFDGLDLEMHRRIANLGEKTFRYDRGAETHAVTFNYTLDRSASQLLDIFEGLSRQQIDVSELQRAMHYDPLGVNDAVRHIENDYNEKLLPQPRQLLPSLDELASNTRFINIARDRARTLAATIRSAP